MYYKLGALARSLITSSNHENNDSNFAYQTSHVSEACFNKTDPPPPGRDRVPAAERYGLNEHTSAYASRHYETQDNDFGSPTYERKKAEDYHGREGLVIIEIELVYLYTIIL